MKSNKKTNGIGRRDRRAFTAEFKAEAVRLMAERQGAGGTLTQLGRELDVKPDLLRAWARQQRDEQGAWATPIGETLEQENRRLRREVATLRQEQAFAKKKLVSRRPRHLLDLKLQDTHCSVTERRGRPLIGAGFSPSKNMARGSFADLPVVTLIRLSIGDPV